MKKVMFYKPGDIRVEDAAVPVPGPGEAVVRNEVSLTCGTDVKIYKRGYRKEPPFDMGHEASGVISAVGVGVSNFAVGDRVVAHNSAPCNKCYFCKKGQHSMCADLLLNNFANGAYAEYQLIPSRIVEQNMFKIPKEISFKQAALLEPFACAVYGTDMTPFDQGDTVCVNGCGPIGLMFIRMCHLRGARVIACDMSDVRLETATKLGANETVNIGKVEDQAKAVRCLTDEGRGVDAAIEAVGLPEVWKVAIDMARPGGFVLCFGGTKKGQEVPIDTTKLHYEQITIRGVLHTTPKHVKAAFELLKMNAITADDFIQNEYAIDDIAKALEEHAGGGVIKNCVVFGK